MDLDIRPMMVAIEGLRLQGHAPPSQLWARPLRRKVDAADKIVLASWIAALAATGGLIWVYRTQHPRSVQPAS